MERISCVDRAAWLKQFEHNAHQIRSLVDYFLYMNDMAGLIGCEPPFLKYLFLRPRIWRRIVFGATQGIQFRLRGPGKKESLARELLMKIPVGITVRLIKDVLKKRWVYAFKPQISNL